MAISKVKTGNEILEMKLKYSIFSQILALKVAVMRKHLMVLSSGIFHSECFISRYCVFYLTNHKYNCKRHENTHPSSNK